MGNSSKYQVNKYELKFQSIITSSYLYDYTIYQLQLLLEKHCIHNKQSITKQIFREEIAFFILTNNKKENNLDNKNINKSKYDLTKLILNLVLNKLKDKDNNIFLILMYLLPFVNTDDKSLLSKQSSKNITKAISTNDQLSNNNTESFKQLSFIINSYLGRNKSLYSTVKTIREYVIFTCNELNNFFIMEYCFLEVSNDHFNFSNQEKLEFQNEFSYYINKRMNRVIVEDEVSSMLKSFVNKYKGKMDEINVSNSDVERLCESKTIGSVESIRNRFSFITLDDE